MPPNYQNGKIYKIYSYENDDVYYGSTVETLSMRMAHHKTHLKLYKEGKYGYLTSFKILELTSAKIELVENYSCNSREELLQREGYYIRNNNCVNKIIAGRTVKEWRNDNKEQIKEYKKEWNNDNKEHIQEYCQQNKEKIKEQSKEWRNDNKENIQKYKKEYYEQNKEQIKEQRKEHQKEYRQQKKEQRKEYMREYRQRNKEQIKEHQKEYRQQQKEQKLMLKEDNKV